MDSRGSCEVISIAIATYEMGDRGAIFIEKAIKSIIQQSYPHIEIVISDHSMNDNVKKVCDQYPVVYIKNTNNRGSSSSNFNNAIEYCTGKYIKILCQDDYLYDENSIEKIVNKLNNSDRKWLVSSYYHTYNQKDCVSLHHPSIHSTYDPLLNYTGTHSCLTITKDVLERFDENLLWFMDCEYYSRLFKNYLHPEYLLEPTVVQSLWEGQVSRKFITESLVNKETKYILNKYKI